MPQLNLGIRIGLPLVCVLGMLVMASGAFAQTYPGRPIRVIREFIRSEIAKWAKVVKDAGIVVQPW
ncbi:MAG: hypothetical protein A3G24_18700 [Betaproteobacteria bacterium RIFCSPLOWO2_12_FULL_62_13]|nr:MAG: hypothetical protein A3G24_18700 [Betaproteobacteria bacterium RIFCSPLOWO2_12_FULL_62_13]